MIKKTAIFGTLILCTLILVYCTTDEENIIGPFGNASKYITASSFSADKTRLYSNGDTTIVKIKILDVDKTPAVGLIVDFSTSMDLGTISEYDTTDISGIAEAIFVTDENAGETIIIANTGIKTYEIPITVVHYQPRYVELFAESPVLLADGVSSTKVNAVLKDSVGKPMEGITVRFNTTLGTLKSKIEITDENGEANTELISSTNEGTAFVTAQSFVTSLVEVEFKQYVPYQLEILSDDLVLLADGSDFTRIVAVPRDDSGNIMTNIPILFSTNNGTLSSEEGTFGNSTIIVANSGNTGSEAIVYLRSTSDGGSAIVTASSYLTSFIEVKFQKYVPAFIELSVSSALLPNDGESSTIVTAVVKDSTGKPMPEETVRFSTTSGTLSSTSENTNQRNVTVLTDQDGIAKAWLFSSNSVSDEIAYVTASSYITSLIEVKFTSNVPNTIEMSASPRQILADGVSVSIITATPKDAQGIPMPGLTVNFSTTHGTLSEYIKVTDANGIATTELKSITIEETAYVTATAGISSTPVGVQFIAYNPTLVELTREDDSILADGVSDVVIKAKIFDASNQEIPGAIIDFSTNLGTLTKATGVVANQLGEATTTLISEGIQGDDQLSRIAATVQGSSVSDTTTVRFRGISLNTYIDSLGFEEKGIYKAYIRTDVLETSNGSPVEESAIEFESNLGIMTPTIIGTDDFGRAYSILESEVTTIDQPNATVTSELASAEEVYIQTSPFTIPGAEILVSSPDNELISTDGGWALVKAILRESNGNATIRDTWIDWSIEPIGTIKDETQTDGLGVTVDTLRTENISSNTNVTVSANYGDYVSDSYNLNFLTPLTIQSLIIGSEPDTTRSQPADSLFPGARPEGWESGTRDIYITALFGNASGNPIPNEIINFTIVPNTNAVIWPSTTTALDDNGRAVAVLTYRVQAGGNQEQGRFGEIVRIWGEVPSYGTRGHTDVILIPILPPEED